MATEYLQDDYYYYSKNAKKFIDIHRSIQIAVESFLATTLLKGDFSKIVYCTPDICFRRRVELVDAEHKDMTSIQPVNLDLPFASYCQTSDFEPDDRSFVMQSAQAIVGEYLEDFGHRLRNLPVKSTYKATVFFSRRDEIRMAHQILFWDKYPQAPIWIRNNVIWNNKLLAIPCNITIENISSKTDYQESDFLTQSKIFPLDIEMTVRSYQVLIPNIDRIIDLPVRWGNTYSPETYEDDDNIYITQEAILVFANHKYGFDIVPRNINYLDEEVQINAEKFFSKKTYTLAQLEDMCGKLPNYQTNDILEGYWTETYEVALNRLSVVQKTDHSCTISYQLKPADKKFFKSITFYIPAHPEIVITDPNQSVVEIDGLYARSKYEIKVVTLSIHNVRQTFALSCTTLDSDDNLAPNPTDGNNATFKGDNILIEAGSHLNNDTEPVSTASIDQESRADKTIVNDVVVKVEESKSKANVTVKRGNGLIGMQF